MSVGNLEGSPHNRTALDDWESLLYILCWLGTYGWNTATSRTDIDDLEINDWSEGTPTKIARKKRHHLDSARNFAIIPDEFNRDIPDIKYLQWLVALLRNALIDEYDEKELKGALAPKEFSIFPSPSASDKQEPKDPFKKRAENISSNKYTVDASLFDALVDKATGSAAVADVSGAAVGASRTLKQRLLQPDDQDVRFLADMLAKRLDESHGEMIFTTSDKENGALMDLSDKDVKRITETLALAAADAQANAFVQLLYDSGAVDAKEAAAGSSNSTTTVKYAREIAAAPASNTNPAVKSTLNSNAVRFTSYLIRRRPQRIEEMMEVRVAVAGNVDAGKST
ncbi:hypothetical protein LPJ55_006009, partial [Coemansia sp. RSA 990]